MSGLRTVLAVAASVLWASAAAAQNIPSFDTVRAAHAPSDITVLDRHGQPLQTLRINHSLRRGPWVALGDMSPALLNAVLHSEDRRFWAHAGVDWQALAASAWAQAWNQRTRGASTVTMQLAGLLDDSLARPAGGRSTGQKFSQVLRAQQLEAGWRKTQILEAYLNAVPLRGELVGVAAASSQLFGIHASGLDHAQAAVLAVMLRGPNANAQALQRRACEVLQQQRLACDGLGLLIEQAFVRRPGALDAAAWAPHLSRHLSRQLVRNPLRSTVDAGVQRVALAALRQQLAELRGRNVEDGAVVVLDNRSGEVLAWVGSSGAGSAAAEVDAVLARRQPGSTLKPFVYALALQQRLITAASRLDDAPLSLAVGGRDGSSGGTLYRPQNYDHQFKGWVSVRTALASSLNVPAVRVGAMLGPEALFAHLNRAGLRLSESAGFHGQALALGSADVTLLDLSNAYRALAQRGQWSPPRFDLAQSAEPAATRTLVSPAVAFIVADMLADRTARAPTFGLDSLLATTGWAAVKTGTSKDMRDNWCVGFTDRYTVGVWVGNASGAPMHGVSGISGAAPVWRALVAHLHAGTPSLAPNVSALPAGLVALQGEWFLAGTEPGLSANTSLADFSTAVATVAHFGIQSPADGSVVVLDPDIPLAAQKLAFEGATGQWFVAGRLVGRGSKLWWPARPGRYELELRAADGSVPERVRFEVRMGARLKRPSG